MHAKPHENNGGRNITGNTSEGYEGAVRAGEQGSSFLSGKGTAVSEEKHRLCWRHFYS